METLGFVGFGRFAKALAEIFAEKGYWIRAFDPHQPPEEDLRCGSLQELASACRIIFVAVPVASMEAAFEALSPHVTAEHVVVDVGSVKMTPVLAMSQTFGDAIPWVASHPLFGPVSLARAEAGLRVVICPSEAHPTATERIAGLYRSIGCTIIDLSPDAHDRIMAQTHALAFFIAKAMLDAEVPTDSPAAPPSFQAMARTIESVRGDAGHLITTLHRENPFSAEYRRRLLTVLGNLDRQLNESSVSNESTEEELALSIAPPVATPELSETRERIDEVDAEIVELLHRRADLVRRAQRAKAAVGRGVVDPERETRLLAARGDWALESGLDPAGVRAIFEAIIAMSCEIQLKQA